MAEPTFDTGNNCTSAEPFALQVLGDSMEPEFPDGCIVSVEPADWCQSGMYVMVMVEDTRWFRQYIKDDEGERLIALNEIYPEIPLNGLTWKMEGMIMQRTLRRHQTESGRRESKHYKYE